MKSNIFMNTSCSIIYLQQREVTFFHKHETFIFTNTHLRVILFFKKKEYYIYKNEESRFFTNTHLCIILYLQER